MAKKKSKADIIAHYVVEHPDATWSTASGELERKGISAGYFASQRSKLKSEGAMGDSPSSDSASSDDGAVASGRKKRGPKKGSRRGVAASANNSNLGDAVEFARKAGGLQNAQALLEELSRVQVAH